MNVRLATLQLAALQERFLAGNTQPSSSTAHNAISAVPSLRRLRTTLLQQPHTHTHSARTHIFLYYA